MNNHLITALLSLPFVAALVVLFMPRQMADGIRRFSVIAMLAELALSLKLLSGDYTTAAYQFVESKPLVPSFGISYTVGIDGISLWLVLLTTFVTPIATYASWTSINTKVKEYAISFLLLETAMIGAFVTLDLFLFYVFWELMLVPMYLIVGIWGGPQRVYAAVKFFLYTMVGSLLMLLAILYLAAQYKAESGVYTFDLNTLNTLVLPMETQLWLYAAFALAFAIKVPMFPFHTWLPDAHVQAPTGGSVILAAVLLKMGGYGFIRFAMPLFPSASHYFGPTLAGLAVTGIVYGAYCAWVQKDVKKLVAYSSVSHLGFVMLGIFSLTQQGLSGAILQMVSHGISTGALFLLVGVIYERRHTRDISEFGGLAKVMPVYATVFVIVTMSSVGLPGTNGFVGEFMILSGAFMSEKLLPISNDFGLTLVAATGVILAAIYMLHATLKLFWGPITKDENAHLADLSGREKWGLYPLVVMIFWIGLYPAFFLNKMTPSVDELSASYSTKLQMSALKLEERFLVPASVKLPRPEPTEPGTEPEADPLKNEGEGATAPASQRSPHDSVLTAMRVSRGVQ